MPIYEYRCNECGHELEAIQKLSEAPLTFCPACQTDGLKKKISAAVFRLRGSGWYETDFKSDGKKNVASDDERGSPAKDNGDASTPAGAGGGDSGSSQAGQSAGSQSGDGKSGGSSGDSKKKEPAKSSSKSATAKAASSESR